MNDNNHNCSQDCKEECVECAVERELNESFLGREIASEEEKARKANRMDWNLSLASIFVLIGSFVFSSISSLLSLIAIILVVFAWCYRAKTRRHENNAFLLSCVQVAIAQSKMEIFHTLETIKTMEVAQKDTPSKEN